MKTFIEPILEVEEIFGEEIFMSELSGSDPYGGDIFDDVWGG